MRNSSNTASLFAKTVSVSVVALFSDFIAFYACLHLIEDNVIAYRVGLSLGASVQFILLNYVYGDKSNFLTSGLIFKSFIYILLFTFNFAVGGALLIFVSRFFENILFSKIIVIVVFFMINFLCYRYLIWRAHEDK